MTVGLIWATLLAGTWLTTIVVVLATGRPALAAATMVGSVVALALLFLHWPSATPEDAVPAPELSRAGVAPHGSIRPPHERRTSRRRHRHLAAGTRPHR